MTEVKKHPSLEPVFVIGKQNSKENPCHYCGSTSTCDCPLQVLEVTTSIASLQKQHEANEAEKKQLTEMKQLLETDEADITQLRYDVLELIRQRMQKKK